LPATEAEQAKLQRSTFEHYYKSLKAGGNGNGLSQFECLILENMSKATGKQIEELSEIALGVRKLEANPAMALHAEFPSLHKHAKETVLAELRQHSQDPEVQIAYLVELAVNRAKKKLEKDYEEAKSRIGEEQAMDYASCLLELQLLQTDNIINEPLLKESLLFAIENSQPVHLTHIKSLRYTYPQDGGLEMIPNTEEFESAGLSGEKRIYPSEEVIFKRLDNIRNLLDFYGIKSELTIIVADHDLEFLFPDGKSIIGPEVKKRALKDAESYIEYLRETHPEAKLVDSLSGFLGQTGILNNFSQIYEEMIKQAKKGEIELVSDKVYEAHVNHQFEHYTEMFGKKYTRDMARHSATHRVADLISLSAVFETFPTPPIVIIDGRGFETKLIGAKNQNSRSIFLTKLKDPVRVVE
jgi:hypothetical protein